VLIRWLKYLRQEYPTVAFKASTQVQKKHLSRSQTGKAEDAPASLIKRDICLGAETLISLLKNYARSEDIMRTITVGVVGLPNVGKSSVINSLKRTKSAKVGATPGVTRESQEFSLDKHIKLLDCPGIIFSQSDRDRMDSNVILRNAVRVEQLEDPVGPALEIIQRCKKEQLLSRYNMRLDADNFEDAEEFLQKLAMKTGKLKKGNQPNLNEVAKILLRDWNSGKIPFFTLPPTIGEVKNIDDDNDDHGVMLIDNGAQQWQDDSILESNGLLSMKDAFMKDYIPMKSSLILDSFDNHKMGLVDDNNTDEEEEEDEEEDMKQ